MTPRQRYLETLLFGKPDKVPLRPGRGRRSTLRNWQRQGLPDDVEDYNEYAYRLAGGTQPWVPEWREFHVNERLIPEFEERVIEKKQRTQIVQDWKGNVCEIGLEYTTEYLRNPIDFVTRRWIKCPVESREDWQAMRRRYDPEQSSRLPADVADRARRLIDRDFPLEVRFSGPFWQVRDWVGFERLCTMFYDDPDFVREMIDFWSGYVARLMQRTFGYVVPDSVLISEDMAYKQFSMISPAMVREYLLPVWRRWADLLRSFGVPLFLVDSDGYIGQLIPIWIESGVHGCEPLEVAAGNDIAAFRGQFGRKMAFRGGVDKRAIAQGGRAIEDEIRRLEPVIRDGGYLPECDHGVPPDVSWPNYVHYVKLLARVTGWL